MFNNLILSGIVFTSIVSSNPAYSGGNNNTNALTNNNTSIEAKKSNKDYIYVADVPLYKGKVNKITETKDGLNILVNRLDGDKNQYESLIFHINKDTALNIEKQNLKIGDNVDIFYSGMVTRSLPGQATAIAVNKVQETFVYEGEINKIIDTKYGKMVSVVSHNKDANFEEIVFNVSNDTKFTNGSLSDLKVGAKIKAVHGPAMTMSLPPQTAALGIEFLK